MKNSHQSPASKPTKIVEKKSSKKTTEVSTSHKWVDGKAILKNNPKIDHRLLATHKDMMAASKDVTHVRRGADYNLAHPLSSKNKPSDAYHRGQRVIANKTR